MIDIVVTTCERLPLLQRTLEYIWERTVTPYRLHVIDDASTSGNAAYLQGLLAEGQVASIHLHRRRVGISAHLRALTQITTSDPLVFSDDDILCPRLEPDWLARGLEALNNPHCNSVGRSRGKTKPGDPVTLCRNVPGSFVFARRAVLAACRVPDGCRSPVKMLCRLATADGWQIGYLTNVYCQHIGALSVRNVKNLRASLERVQPVDGDTLEPPEEYRR